MAVGVEACSYDLITRMDTDADIMLPTRIEKQFAEFNMDPKLAIVGSNIDEFYHSPEKIVGRRIVPKTNNEICDFQKEEIHLII